MISPSGVRVVKSFFLENNIKVIYEKHAIDLMITFKDEKSMEIRVADFEPIPAGKNSRVSNPAVLRLYFCGLESAS